MKAALCIGLGGFIGALCRHGMASWIGRSSSGFPIGILAVNVAGCFAFGLLFGIVEATGSLGKEARLFVFSGFLGAFTTFSTFGHDTFVHLRSGQFGHAAANVGLSVALGLIAVWAGLSLAATFAGKSP